MNPFPKRCGRTRFRSISLGKRRKPTSLPCRRRIVDHCRYDCVDFSEILGKPKDREDAIAMLRKLSGHVHEVITGVCITTKEKTVSFSASSTVCFARLDDDEIVYYVDKYRPFDKAGSYGIQEWIGYVAVEASMAVFIT